MYLLFLIMKMYKRDKVQPDRIMVYIETHTKKNGDPVDEASDVAIVWVII